jgi:hypothetical protein
MMRLNLTVAERELLEEALVRASSRLESLGRANLASAAPHERKAAAMRALRQRLRNAAGLFEKELRSGN